jgi:UPF0716 family protein affecting phage T7 exclusion
MDMPFDLALDWEHVIWWTTGLSLVAVVSTLIGVPWVVSRLPEDYFNRERRAAWHRTSREPVAAFILGLAKNALGAVLVVLGTIMLVTPGQGLLTLLIGLLLLNFPGKYRLERWLVGRRGVLRALNWMRERHGRQPLEAPELDDGDF